MTIHQLQSQLFSNQPSFQALCLDVFRFQYAHNSMYRAYCDLVHPSAASITNPLQIPFLPIQFFKSHRVLLEEADRPDLPCFESSGTTGQIPSRHWRPNDELYIQSFRTCFRECFGEPTQYCILGLLPSYLERANSSLVYMVRQLIEDSQHPASGFFLHNHEALHDTLLDLQTQQKPTLLFGVTYALLDFASAFPMPLAHTTIIETGGMKGRREELNREEVHQQLKSAFQLESVASEYGMTELFSQAYALNDGRFVCPPRMQVLVRDLNDPLDTQLTGRGALQVIDLANLYSCSFIATEDLGMVEPDGSFKVLGRLDHSEARGCSLLAV